MKSNSFSKGLLVCVAVSVPIIFGVLLGHLEIGLALCYGAFWSSPSDVSGSFLHKKTGILISAALVATVGFIGGYLYYETWLPLPILGVLGFGISFISVYGFRASLISFSGLTALVLSFAHDSEVLEIYQYALLVGLGGIWYLFLAKIWNRINPKAEAEEILSKTFMYTSEFLETRGKLFGNRKDRKKLQSHLYYLQSELIKQHETLREILILSRKSSGRSHYHGKRLLVFVQLVEMLETAIANPVDYDKMDILFNKHPKFAKSFQELIFGMAKQLKIIAQSGNNTSKIPKNEIQTKDLEKLKKDIFALIDVQNNNNTEDFLVLSNLFSYQAKQFKKLNRIKWLLGNPDIGPEEFIANEVAKKFLVRQDYDPKLLLYNLSFRSSIFRHSLRLAVTLMASYALGNLFPFQNPHWILLTIIVIMRPSYGLTKARSKDRVLGTLIGAAVAVAMVYLIQNPYAYGVLGAVSLIIAFAMVQKNYKASTTFITLTVIFVYAITHSDVLSVIQYRILDTLVGAVLAYMAMLWLWPAWGFFEIKENIKKSVKANQEFLSHISNYYQQKDKLSIGYKVSRKNAFLETSNLSAAFQKITQEPKSKLKNQEKIYELVELNHTFLSSLASLSTYIQLYQTIETPDEFKAAISKINKILLEIIQVLKGKTSDAIPLISDDEAFFESQLTALRSQKSREENLQHSHLVWEQLQWLFSISHKMLKLTKSVKLD
ncbi:FUSC family protein [Gelatiniphilus marinus]|uniref:FUSC family protein n=1 Tax=Gelatiniphilus marinus TaxID=1759464 RepID=A0ABW5JTZ7_9FLAO